MTRAYINDSTGSIVRFHDHNFTVVGNCDSVTDEELFALFDDNCPENWRRI